MPPLGHAEEFRGGIIRLTGGRINASH